MTQEHYEYRTSPFFLRNQFSGEGFFEIPTIPKPNVKREDLDDLLLIGFDKAKVDDLAHKNRFVHFFLYDYKFKRVWNRPEHDLERLKNYTGVLSPDFSMYLEMAPIMQLYNTFRNRWCGAYWASKGISVIPTVNWGDASTFDFCFEGIVHGSPVAVSTYMASEHDNRQDQKEWFMTGYRELLRRIDPEFIICYNTPFPEMEGDIIFVDYDLSSWKYMRPKKNLENIGHKIVKMGYVMKGGGSAFGGKWKPSKKEDERLLGTPGEIKVTQNAKGEKIETKIGDDGRAERERHWTSHGKPKFHSVPHDHIINWDFPIKGIPNFIKPHINYFDGKFPELKKLGGNKMSNIIGPNTPEENRFKTISDFKDCLIRGGEIEFEWKGVEYGVFSTETYYYISRVGEENETTCDIPDGLLDFMLSDDKLRDVITNVNVLYRSF